MEMEDRVKVLENKVSELVGAINYLAKKVVTIESNLTEVNNDETALHKSLTLLASEMRVLLPKLESSVEYVNSIREGDSRGTPALRISPTDADATGLCANSANPTSNNVQPNVGDDNQAQEKSLVSVSVTNERRVTTGTGLLGPPPSVTSMTTCPPILAPNSISLNNTSRPAAIGYGINGFGMNGSLSTGNFPAINYMPPHVGVHPSYKGLLGGGPPGAVRVTPICFNMGLAPGSVPGFGAPSFVPMGNGFATGNSFNQFINNGAPSNATESVVNGSDKMMEAKRKRKVLNIATPDACSKTSKLCTKFCNAAAHKCDYGEHLGEPCPPCLEKVDKKFKCGHTVNLHCFVASTNTNMCPTCEVTSQLNTENTTAVNSLNEWQQEVLENIRVVVNKFDLSNVEECKTILVDIVKTHDELTPAVSNMLCQKGLMESCNNLTPDNFASLVSKVVNYLGTEGVKFKEQVKTTIIQIFQALMDLSSDIIAMKLVESKMRNVQAEQRKAIMFRFVQELYEWNVLTVKDVRLHILEPILESPSSESASLVASFLVGMGSTVFQDINEMKDEEAKQEFITWFENYIACLSDLSVQIDERGTEHLRLTVDEISESFRSGWTALKSERGNNVAQKRRKVPTESSSPQENGQAAGGSSSSLSSSDETYCTAKTWANTKSSLTASWQSLSSGVKASVPISVTRKFFSDYMLVHKTKKKIRITWLQNYFFDKDESYMGTFVRTLSHQILELEDRNWIEQMGHMLAIMIEANIVSGGRVAKSFHEGIIWSFIGPDNQNPQYALNVPNVSKVLVNAMIEASDNLSWLATVGATLHTNHPDRWKILCQEIFTLIETRYKIARLRLLVKQTESKDKEKILPEFQSYKPRIV